MRTFYDSDEQESFTAVKELLVRHCGAWADRSGLLAEGSVVDAALTFRFNSVDGRLAFWTTDLVDEFLLGWVPRTFSVTAAEAPDAPSALTTWLKYLQHYELADPTGDALPLLEQAATLAAGTFRQAMGDERNFGPAKYWMMIALAQGVDPTDQAALRRFGDEVAAGEIPYDAGVLAQIAARHEELLASEQPEPLAPPVRPPSAGDLAAGLGDSRILQQLRSLVDWVADGRDLTQTGALKLADARDLVALLETGDVIDPVIGQRTFRTKSSIELPELTVLVEWAKKMRLIRVVKKRLVVVAKAKPLLRDSESLWGRAFETVGELADVLFSAMPWSTSMLVDIFDLVLPDVLNALYGLLVPVPSVRLAESAWLSCGEVFAVDDADEPTRTRWRTLVYRDFESMLDILAALGALELTTGRPDPVFFADLSGTETDIGQHDDQPSPFPLDAQERIRTEQSEPTTLVRLTALGHQAVRASLLARGRQALLVGELSGVSAGQLLGMVSEYYPVDSAKEEIDGWLTAHAPDGLEQLLAAIRRCPFRSRAAGLLSTLVSVRPDGQELLAKVRLDPVLGPLAVQLLMNEGELTMESLSPAEGMLGFTEQFLQLLELGGPEAVLEMTGQVPDIAELAFAVAGSGHPDQAGVDALRTLVFEPALRHRPGGVSVLPGGVPRSAGKQRPKSKRRPKR